MITYNLPPANLVRLLSTVHHVMICTVASGWWCSACLDLNTRESSFHAAPIRSQPQGGNSRRPTAGSSHSTREELALHDAALSSPHGTAEIARRAALQKSAGGTPYSTKGDGDADGAPGGVQGQPGGLGMLPVAPPPSLGAKLLSLFLCGCSRA